MEVVVRTAQEDASAVAAEAVIAALRPAPDRPATLGLATGSSPLGLYRELAVAAHAGRADFSGVRGFALDEYVGLPPGAEQSYRATLEREVCAVMGMKPEHLQVPSGIGDSTPSGDDAAPALGADDTLAALVEQAEAYEAAIASAGGVDVQILGIGANGHLGFNEPGSALRSRTRVKRLTERTRRDNARFFGGIEQVPTHCVTQGLGTILAAGRLVLVAFGGGKAAAVAAALEGPITASCPGSILQIHPDVVVALDEEAAADLANREYYAAAAQGLG
ncbi:MAG: glucosamine-6-phosphate deaminase [Nostocoides sp.]